MSYAQTNFKQIQGINGKYTIAQIGCFITAFANLMQRDYGYDVTPLAINDSLRDNGRYIDVDDGIRDDVDWNFVSLLNGNIKVTRTGKGRPEHRSAIVKFVYGGGKTHFCLWDGDGYYIDSWDGLRKRVASYYGEPVAFAEYGLVTPPPVAPIAPPPKRTIVYTKLDTPIDVVTSKEPTRWWNLGFYDYGDAQAAAVLSANTPFRAYGKAQIVDHPDKPIYYMIEQDFNSAQANGSNNNGINVVDLALAPAKPELLIVDSTAPVQPEPVATPALPEPAPEPINAPAVADDGKVTVKVNPTVPDAWKTTFKVNLAGEYTAHTSLQIYDVEDRSKAPKQLLRGESYQIAGTFSKDNVDYYRTKKSVERNDWYGIPVIALKEENLDTDGDIWDLDITDETKHEISKGKKKLIKVAAKHDFKRDILHFFGFIKKKGNK